MSNFVCKVASINEMNSRWDYLVRSNRDDSNWVIWKERSLERASKGQSITYYGILDGEIITECTALLDSSIVQNSDGLVNDTVAYLSAFRTVEEYQGKGYFSSLFKFMLSDLKSRGYEKVTLGVEPNEVTNMQIYFHYGFTEFVKLGTEVYPDGEQIYVLYYAKNI